MPLVLFEKKDHIALITLNRPESMNAMNGAMGAELTEAWYRLRDEDDLWVAVITGAGDRAFCAGQDRYERATRDPSRPQAPRPPSLGRGLELWKPIIAAINGYAVGGGLEMAMACDIRIASETATFGLPEITLASLPGGGGTQRLPRLIPFGLALEILLTGDRISAQDAYRLGLVSKVVPPAQLMPTAEALASRMCQNSPVALRSLKRAVYRGIDLPLAGGLALESDVVSMNSTSEDYKEGAQAFAEKRKAVYKGR